MPSSEPDPPLRVLCVDDNHDVADSEVDLLTTVGFEARACYDGASTLRAAAEFRPCVCLLDLNMPGMDGDELAVRLREQEGGPPPVLVAVTARSDDESRRRIRDAGLEPHLIKPVDPFQLISVVNALWETWSSKRATTEGAGGTKSRAPECG